jgi:hypothetical protein
MWPHKPHHYVKVGIPSGGGGLKGSINLNCCVLLVAYIVVLAMHVHTNIKFNCYLYTASNCWIILNRKSRGLVEGVLVYAGRTETDRGNLSWCIRCTGRDFSWTPPVYTAWFHILIRRRLARGKGKSNSDPVSKCIYSYQRSRSSLGALMWVWTFFRTMFDLKVVRLPSCRC